MIIINIGIIFLFTYRALNDDEHWFKALDITLVIIWSAVLIKTLP